MLKIITSAVAAGLLLTGCSGGSGGTGTAGAPPCSSPEVQDLVRQVTDGELKVQLCEQVFVELANNEEKILASGEITRGARLPEALIHTNWGYADLLPYAGQNEVVDYMLRKTEEKLAAAPYQLTLIRTTASDDALRHCDCAAEIDFGGGTTHSITYTAQYTDSGEEIVVEVFGL